MASRDDIALLCVSVSNVPNSLTEDKLIAHVIRHAQNTSDRVTKSEIVPGAENDPNLRRWILMLNSYEVARTIRESVQDEEIKVDEHCYTIVYERSIPCELPEEWMEEDDLEVDGDPDPPEKPSRPQNQQYTPGPSQDYGMSGPVSGFYQNYPGSDSDGAPMNQGQGQVHEPGGPGQMHGPEQTQPIMSGPLHGQGHAIGPTHAYMPDPRYGQYGHGQMPGFGQGPMPGPRQTPDGAGEVQNPGQEQVPGAGPYMGNYYPYPYMAYCPPPEGGPNTQGANQGYQGQIPPTMYPPQAFWNMQGYPGNFYPQTQTAGGQNEGHQQPPGYQGQGHTTGSHEGQGSRTPPPAYSSGEDNLQGQDGGSEKSSNSSTPNNQSLSAGDGFSNDGPNSKTAGLARPNQAIADQRDYMQKLSDKFQGEAEREAAFASDSSADQGLNMQKLKEKLPDGAERKTEFAEGQAPNDGQTFDDTKPTKILVSNLPSTAHEDFLEMFFENERKYGGGDVKSVEVDEANSTAIVEFEEPEAVEIVLRKLPIKMLGAEVKVEIYIPVPLCTIEVRGPPESILEDMLEVYFENTKRSGGDEIEKIVVDDEAHIAYVTFKDEEVAQRVVDKKNHKIGKKPIYVTIHTPVNAKKSKSAPESEEDEMEFRRETMKENNTVPDEPTPLDTIEVQGPPEVMTEERLRLFFEHKKSSGGGDVISVDVDGGMAYVTFETEEVAQRVVDKGNHKINKKSVSVRLNIPEKDKIPTYHTSESEEDEADGTRETAEDDYDTAPEEEAPLCIIEVRGPPDAIAEDPLTYYFENKRSGGGDIVSIEIDDDVAYITFETEQIAQRVVARDDHKISGKHVSVQIHNPEPPVPPEPLRTVQVNGMKRVKSRETVELYFENRKRSGGGDIVEFRIEETDEDVAYITFETEEVAEAVVNRSHRVEGCALDVSLYIPPLPTQTQNRNRTDSKSPEKPDIPEEPPKAVKVKGLKKVHSQETVQYYFENKRRSRGGEIVEFKYDEEDDNVAYITFEDADVAQAVASKSHQVDNVDLSVSLYTPPKPRPCYEDRVIIEGVKTTTTKDCLFNFLEAKTKAVPESLVYGEKEGVVMVTFETNPDFDKLEHISKNLKLEGASLKVSRVTISNCIMVTDVPESTTKDTVEYYFENKRRSGGGTVEKVLIQDDGSILVYFIDHEIIDDVLKKSHTIDGHSINVNLYLDRLGCTQGDGSEPRLKIPDPIVISNMEPQKIKFLLNSSVNKGALERQLVDCHAKIVWPEDAKSGKITMECTLTADVKDCRKLAKAWIQTTERNVDDFMKQIIVVKKSVISDVWDKVMELLQKINISSPEAVAVFVDKEQGNITVVGLKRAADTVSGDIGKIIKEVEDEAEKEKQKVKENLTTIEPAKTKMLLAAKFPNKMEEKYPNMKVKINQNKNEISFEGLLADVRGAKCDMYEMIQGFAQCTIDNIPKLSAGLYQLKQVKEHIVKKLKQSHVTAIWEVVDQKLVIYSISEDCIKQSTDIIKSAVVESSIGLNKDSRALINSELWQTKVEELHGQYNGRAFIEASQDFSKVHVCTTDDIANETMDAMKKFLRLHTVLEESIQFTRSITKLIEAHHIKDLNEICKDLTSSHVQITYGHQVPGFKIRGTEEGIAKAKVKLQQLANRVKSRDHTVKKPGLGVHMQSSEGKDTLNMVENALPCVVKIKGDDNEDDYMTYDSATTEGFYETIPADGGLPSQTGSRIHASCKAYDDRKIYTAEGDMTELSVDVLVNTADEKLSLTGGLGKVIVSKGGDEIANACSDYIKKEGKLSEGDAFMSPAGRLKSKFIIHIVGPVWKGGNDKEVDQLTEAVFRAMMQASRKNLSSIALPAISCGVYSFPVKRATAVIAAAVKNFFREEQESSLREVYLCDVKVNTVEAFTEALVGEFGQGSVARYQQQSAAYRPKPPPPRNQGMSMPDDIKASTTSDEEDSDSDSYHRKKIPPGAQKVLPSMPNLPPRRSSHGGGGGVAIGNIGVSIVKDEIAKQKVDVIVNTTAKNLDLKNGAVSASLSKAAGPQLQQEVTQKYPNGIRDGEVAITAGHGLRCSHIVHGSMMNWDGGTAATGALHDLMAASLKEAQNKGAASIAFPAIGTGNLGFPRDVVAKEMFNAISKFSKSTPQSTIKDVRFIVYQKDFPTIKAFEAEERLWTSGDRNTMKRQTRMFEAGPVYSNVQQSQKDSDDDETDYTTGGHHFETDFYSQAHHAKPHPHKLIHANTVPNLHRERNLSRLCKQGFWLEDEHIDEACKLIKKNNPAIHGIQEVCVVSFGKGQKVDDPFLQILNSEGQHWITVTTIGCDKGHVHVYDSLYRHIHRSALLNILHLIKFDPSTRITIEMPQFQKQNNKADCGLFAIAAAFSLALGRDPSKEQYDIYKMRPYLKQCLEQNQLAAFPKYNGSIKILKRMQFGIYQCCQCKYAVFEDGGFVICEGCSQPCHPARDTGRSKNCCFVETGDMKLCLTCSRKI